MLMIPFFLYIYIYILGITGERLGANLSSQEEEEEAAAAAT